MAVKFIIESGNGNGVSAGVSSIGELIMRPFDYSTPVFKSLNVDDTAFNFFKPIAGQQFVITGIVADANRDVGVNGASVVIYEATSETEITVDKELFQFDMAKQSSKQCLPLIALVREGSFLNAKTDDNNVLVTIMGYFIPV